MTSIKSFFKTFALSADVEQSQVDHNLYQAGLLLSYATQGGNNEVTDAMVELTNTLSGKGKGSASKAITKLEGLLAESRDQVVAHMNKLIAQAPKGP